MAYCTSDDLLLALDEPTLVQLVDDEQLSSDREDLAQACRDNAKVQRRLDWAVSMANGEVDAALRARYTVPLASTPTFIRHIATTIALHALFTRRAHAFGGVPKWITERYDAAQKSLLAIREGKLDLGAEPPPAESSAIVADTDGPDRQFTHATMEDF